ncbi:hypothetical protein ACWEKU_17040 [Streptomyces californicus]
MDRGGDLSPGPTDTAARFRHGLARDKGRRVIQRAVIERSKAEFASRPRGGSAVLLTAGAPGAGKSTVQHRLGSWQNEDSEPGRVLTGAHGLKVEDHVVLDPDEFKRALHAKDGDGLGHSISRRNAERLAEQGLPTGLITTERGAFPPTGTRPTTPRHTPPSPGGPAR